MSARISLFCMALAGCGHVSGELEHAAPIGYEPRVPVSVTRVARERLPAACDLEPGRLVGCSKLWPGERCEIYVARGLTPRLERDVLAHERAHCGGWVHGE